MRFMCCFCGETLREDAGALELGVSRLGAAEGEPAQGFVCHPQCLAACLYPDMPFDPEVFTD